MKKSVLISIVFLTVSTVSASNLVVNPGFETSEITYGGWPSSYGNWNGDYSAIVGTAGGITPLDGSEMLQFKDTSFCGAGSGDSSQVFQLIDVSTYSDAIVSGSAVASASAYFNRVTGTSDSDTHFAIAMFAFGGNISSFPEIWENSGATTALARVGGRYDGIYTDTDPLTWEIDSVEFVLPVGTDYLVAYICAYEDVVNDSSHPEFDGHFADSVSLEIIPEPMTLALLAFGGLLIRRRK
ncbi:MAG: PEP-CTERM sorting domain-containing protein [Anaerohalosphaeraceae bacterium]|nr:PEP-CTERM sorting domain-containing protein [Anaerohalosphaeraceae bacterium]